MDKELIRLGARTELARREFFFYCQLKAPDFYKDDREYLTQLCNSLQEFVESDEEVCVINVPPRHGKSRTAGNLVEWFLGNDPTKKIMTGSYNETLSTMFSKNVRNSIQAVKADIYKPVFSDVFPGVRIKYGDAAMNLWSLEEGYNNYLATSPTGTATGFGCDLMIIDDLIKAAKEAYNASVLEEHWTWFTDTMLSRLEEGGKIIIIMTRWHSEDLAGRVLEWCKEKGKRYRHIAMKALIDKESHTMLCPEILSYASYMDKISAMGEDIASANYNQEPIDLKGQLYTSFKTYDDVPRDTTGKPLFSSVRNYTDTADEGSDYLCSITYGVYNKEAYILDVIYTQKPMEDTEPMVAKALFEYGVNRAKIESNNGGRGFARSVNSILKQEYKSNKTKVRWFHQSENKIARILSNSTWVMNHIYYPKNWKDRWPDYYKAMYKYQREGNNAHDDAPDATTGVAENTVHFGGVSMG
ncbi:phage terminase large subunit [[Clostridium] scindens]|jgi:predicted phage terminase large subunit-like protein|uniref:phage terminase large subunit n=1 Tax=Clostridium scindens (strain JCM 10418 / VPI 12708) TaxID=29347 RepID=UPI001E3CB950|nr:phage terminase large subunit [[Clostridium] scindens]BCZ31312.1 terminase [[Clostridium] scindens]